MQERVDDMIDKVSAERFYMDDGDKIKLNWFIYEYSNVMFKKIEKSPKLASYRKKYNEENIVDFCVYFSKRLRQSIFNLYAGRTKELSINGKYVYEFYPDNSLSQMKRLLEAANDAWVEHIQACVNCPNQCTYECFEITNMFDNLKRTGWPT
jgi:hypothetical protein